MSDGQDQEAERPEAAAQEHAVAGQEAQEKGQALKRDPFFDKTYAERQAVNGYHNMIGPLDGSGPVMVFKPDYDAQDDAEAIKLWLWYR